MMSSESELASFACALWLAGRPNSTSDPVSFFSPMAQILFWTMVFGIFLFCMGFKWLRFRRRIQDTPFSKMGSASIGLVEVSGKASGPRTIPAALTGAECFYYRATAWRKGGSSSRSEWQRAADECMSVPFFVEDSTGKLYVRPEGAEMEVHQTLKQDFDAHIYRGQGSWPEPIRSLLARNAVDDSKDLRLEEHCIKPGETLFVIGTLGETPETLTWDASPHSGATRMLQVQLNGPIVRTTRSSWKIERNPSAAEKTWTVTRSAESTGRNPGGSELLKEVLGGLGTAGSSVNVVVNNFVVNRTGRPGERSLATAVSGAATLPEEALEEISRATQGAISPARLREMIQQTRGPGTGNAGEAVSVPEQLPKVGIGKGRPGDPFFISWRSQKDVAGALGRRALLSICGGPVIAVVSLYALLQLLGKIPAGGW
jgi:hypothetical protein